MEAVLPGQTRRNGLMFVCSLARARLIQRRKDSCRPAPLSSHPRLPRKLLPRGRLLCSSRSSSSSCCSSSNNSKFIIISNNRATRLPCKFRPPALWLQCRQDAPYRRRRHPRIYQPLCYLMNRQKISEAMEAAQRAQVLQETRGVVSAGESGCHLRCVNSVKVKWRNHRPQLRYQPYLRLRNGRP